MTSPDILEPDATLPELAGVLRMSTRWVRDRIKDGTFECTRRGNKIMFTPEQVAQARQAHAPVTLPTDESITTGPAKGRKIA